MKQNDMKNIYPNQNSVSGSPVNIKSPGLVNNKPRTLGTCCSNKTNFFHNCSSCCHYLTIMITT